MERSPETFVPGPVNTLSAFKIPSLKQVVISQLHMYCHLNNECLYYKKFDFQSKWN